MPDDAGVLLSCVRLGLESGRDSHQIRREAAIVNTKAKGTRAEHRTMRILEAAGYVCTRASASLGLFDVIAVGPADVRLIQVKAGTKYLAAVEREQIRALAVPGNVSRECWRFPDRCRAPLIERL